MMTLPVYIALSFVTAGLALILAWLLASRRVEIRQRTLWVIVAVSVVVSVALWNGVELRFDDRYYYWRDDWDWESSSGPVQNIVAKVALFGGPLFAVGVAVAAALSALVRRIGRQWLRTVAYLVVVPLVGPLALGFTIALLMWPMLFWSELTS